MRPPSGSGRRTCLKRRHRKVSEFEPPGGHHSLRAGKLIRMSVRSIIERQQVRTLRRRPPPIGWQHRRAAGPYKPGRAAGRAATAGLDTLANYQFPPRGQIPAKSPRSDRGVAKAYWAFDSPRGDQDTHRCRVAHRAERRRDKAEASSLTLDATTRRGAVQSSAIVFSPLAQGKSGAPTRRRPTFRNRHGLPALAAQALTAMHRLRTAASTARVRGAAPDRGMEQWQLTRLIPWRPVVRFDLPLPATRLVAAYGE